MRLWNFLINHWRLIYGLGLAFFIFYAAMLFVTEPSAEADSIIYLPVLFREVVGQFVVLQAVFLVFGAAVYSSKRSDWGVGVLMIIVPIIIAAVLASTIVQPFIGDTRLFHQSSVRVGGHAYNLAGYQLKQLAAYECDVLGIVCHVIYRGGGILLMLSQKDCDDPPRWEVGVDTVSLIVHCETVFTHHVLE